MFVSADVAERHDDAELDPAQLLAGAQWQGLAGGPQRLDVGRRRDLCRCCRGPLIDERGQCPTAGCRRGPGVVGAGNSTMDLRDDPKEPSRSDLLALLL